MIWLTRFVVRSLQSISKHLPSDEPEHLATGKRGESEAYLYLRTLGYRIVGGNFRVPYNRGEIDLIGWDRGVLCFIEVKTRTSADFAPPSAAVDLEKKRRILAVARRYIRRLPGDRPPPCRFDVVSVVMGDEHLEPEFTLQKGAFSWEDDKPRGSRREYRRFWRKR